MANVVPKGKAREHILKVAADMIAIYGTEGVSIRKINANAGLSPATLHYHFGSLVHVVEAILDAHMVPLMEQRDELIFKLKKTKSATPARDLVEFLVLPLAAKMIDDEEFGLLYLRFLTRLFNDRNPTLAAYSKKFFVVHFDFYQSMISRAMPDLTKEATGIRMTALANALLNTLANLNLDPPPYQSSKKVIKKKILWQRVNVLIDFLTGGLSAPMGAGDRPGIF